MASTSKALYTNNPFEIDRIINKVTLLTIFLFFNFMVTYRVLLVSVIFEVEIIAEALYEVSLFVYVFYRILKRIAAGNFRLNSFELYLGLLFILPVVAAFASNSEFGQPFIYGFLAYRDFYLILGALVVYNMLRSKIIEIELVERMLVLTAWINIIMFYGMTFFVDPAQFIETGLAGANDVKGGDVYYRFNMAFLFFGTIYYLVKAVYRKRLKYLIYSFLFLSYVVFIRFDRTSIASLLVGLTAFYLTSLTPRKQVLLILLFIVPITLLLTFVAFFAPEILMQYYVMFEDAVSTLVGAANAQGDESVRLDEVGIALEYIGKNPWWGNGKVSGQWVEGGYNYFFGYFYASDVGIIGQVFMYGFIGAGLLYYQFLLALNYALKIKHIKRNVLLITAKFLMLATLFDSITNGYLTIYAAQSITALSIIYYFYERDKVIGAHLAVEKAQKLQSDRETEAQNI